MARDSVRIEEIAARLLCSLHQMLFATIFFLLLVCTIHVESTATASVSFEKNKESWFLFHFSHVPGACSFLTTSHFQFLDFFLFHLLWKLRSFKQVYYRSTGRRARGTNLHNSDFSILYFRQKLITSFIVSADSMQLCEGERSQCTIKGSRLNDAWMIVS